MSRLSEIRKRLGWSRGKRALVKIDINKDEEWLLFRLDEAKELVRDAVAEAVHNGNHDLSKRIGAFLKSLEEE